MMILNIRVTKDLETGILTGVAQNLPGLVVEAATRDEMLREIELLLPDFLDGQSGAEFGTVDVSLVNNVVLAGYANHAG